MYKLRQIRLVPLIFTLLLFFIITGMFTGLTATNTVSNSNAGEITGSVNPDQLKPTECNGINIQNLVVLSNGDSPTNQNDLILGTTGADVVNGGGGNDCIMGGGGSDRICTATGFLGWLLCIFAPDTYLDGLRGGAGNDVILGGPGDDAIFGDGGTDICYGEGGNNYLNCETNN